MVSEPGALRSWVGAPAGAGVAEAMPASAHDAVHEASLVTWAPHTCVLVPEDAVSSHYPCQPTPGALRVLRKPGSQAPDSPGMTGPTKGRAQGSSW